MNLLQQTAFARPDTRLQGWHSLLLHLLCLLLPWQFFVTFPPRVDVSVAMFVVAAALVLTLYRSARLGWWKPLVDPSFVAYGLMLVCIALASLWFAPDNLREAANVIAHAGLCLAVLLVARQHALSVDDVATSRQLWLRCLVLSCMPLASVGLVLAFRPELEQPWLNAISGILIDEDTALSNNNIRDISKIGVVYVNCNVGAVFWGMCWWTTLWAWAQERGRYWRGVFVVAALLFACSIVHAGSRAALLALVLSFVVVAVMTLWHSTRAGMLRLLRTSLLLFTATMVTLLVLESTYLKPASIVSVIARTRQQLDEGIKNVGGDRALLWRQAADKIRQAPLLGYGVVPFKRLGLQSGLPPHNMFLQVWLYGGLGALVAMLAFFIFSVRTVTRKPIVASALLSVVLLAWLFAQGMFTNLIFSDARIGMLLGLCIGFFGGEKKRFGDGEKAVRA